MENMLRIVIIVIVNILVLSKNLYNQTQLQQKTWEKAIGQKTSD